MLPKTKRVTTELFKEVVAKGTSFYSVSFSFKLIYTKTAEPSRFSVAVSKKVAQSAVDRNKLRRRTNAALAKIYPQVKNGYLGVFFVKDAIKTKTLPDIAAEILFLLKKSGCVIE